jgi:superfamily II DNA/RNA helicase
MPQHERVQFLSDTPETDAQNTAPLPSIQETVAPDAAPVETVAAEPAVEPVAEPAAVPEAAEAAEDIAEPAAPQDESDADERVAEDAAAEADGFAPLGLSEPILRALHDKGYLRPTPIQAQAIPTVLMGRDVLGCAQTGTGKTAGFTLPLLDILSGSRARARMPRSLILEPTRELALQVAENFVAYGKYLKLNHALLIGGESMNDQKDALAKGVDVLIATPGRLIDLFERGGLLMRDVRVLVIDEADRMLDMGFIPDIERIVAMLPANRQTLFFSATMAPEIRRLADAFLSNPKEITVSKPASVAVTITSGLVLVNELDKREALRRLIRSEDVQNALIFCNRKRDVDILLKSLLKHGFSAGALHGDLAQSVRFATLEKFKAGELRLLVCSDVAARGIDIGGLSHVFNFDVPHHAEDYVHRIGRTGRAGKEGRAFTIATPDERQAVEAVEKLIAMPIPRIEIPGLDVVEWAEGDGRRGRGRGRGGKPAGKSAPRAPKEAAAVVETPREAPAPRSRHRREEPAAPRAEEPRRRDRAEQPRAEPRTVYATDNNGPNVRGFGADIPAFMLIRKRGPLAEILEEPSEIEEDDISHGNHGGEEIAA